jgi:hypothetical protein
MTYTETMPSAANEVAKNEHITSLPWILPELYLISPVFAQAGYLYPNTPMVVEPLFHLRSDSTARPFDISSLPTPQHATIAHSPPLGQTSTSPGPPPTPKTYQPDAEDILNTITANADNNLQRKERGKLGHMHKPSTPNTPFIHGDEVIGGMVQAWVDHFVSSLKCMYNEYD